MKKMSFLVIGLLLLSIVAMSGCADKEEADTTTPVEEDQGNMSPDSNMPPAGEMPGNNSTMPPAGEMPGNNSSMPPAGGMPGNNSSMPPAGEMPGNMS